MLLSALALGFLGSLHCLGMCGPIAFMLPLDRDRPAKKVAQLFVYHFGRILSYGLLGIAFGLAGKGLQFFGVQQKLSIGIGMVMIVLVLFPKKTFSNVHPLGGVQRLLIRLKSKLGKSLQKKSPETFLTVGFLNGFLPCGLVYIALLGAIAAGGPLYGLGYMVLFGLGTIPLMTTAVYAGGYFSAGLKAKIRKMVPVFVVVIGVLFIVRGMGLGIPYLSPKQVSQEMVAADMECHQP
ncbi:MAG: sulfite exporter TauE/SafE family protein [Bacteroidota bacterium]